MLENEELNLKNLNLKLKFSHLNLNVIYYMKKSIFYHEIPKNILR